METYYGELTFKLRTIIEKGTDDKETKNMAHEGLSDELFKQLTSFIQANGLEVLSIAADLNHRHEATPNDIRWVEESKNKGQSEVDVITGKTRTTKISFD